MNAREAAYRVLWEIEEGAFANLALDEFLRREPGMKAVDKGFLTELVYGTVKHRTRLDWLINATVKKVEKLALGPRLLLRLSYYQLLFMDRCRPCGDQRSGQVGAKLLIPGGLLNQRCFAQLLAPAANVVWPDRKKTLDLFGSDVFPSALDAGKMAQALRLGGYGSFVRV